MPEKITAIMPTAPVVQQFIALKDFNSEEMQSTYCKGMKYSIRAGNAKLAAEVEVWLDEGKVQLI